MLCENLPRFSCFVNVTHCELYFRRGFDGKFSPFSSFEKMALQEQFDKAAAEVKSLKETPKDDQLLELYALFKQATVGDVNTERPGLLDFKGKAKWDAWNHKKGTDSEKAKQDYVNFVQELVGKLGLEE